jgi:threonyl-tRNA synthetase
MKAGRISMRILLTHSDFIEYEAKKKATENAEPIQVANHRIDECLVVFTSAEEGDDDTVIDKTVKEIKDVASQVGAGVIVVYPFVHLSSRPAKPARALEIVKKIESELKKDKEVYRAPFGWYKAFTLKVKGHPLSELSREIRSDSEAAPVKPAKKYDDEDYDPKELLRQISKTKLDREKLPENDHRVLGQKLDLFSFSELAPGMVFWHNNGLIIYNELVDFWRQEHRKADYKEISTPQILDSKLWKISGHWEKYKDSQFITQYEDRDFIVKPMNCPGGMILFKEGQKSYRDLPLRVAEMGIVHRQELSGVLNGLFRVIKFTQDDAHLFCTEEQLEPEIEGVMNMIMRFFNVFGLQFDHVELSTRPEKRIGADEMWDKAERLLEHVLIKNKVNYKINPGDGAFYGPKIDFHLKDSLNRTWQCSTIQLDFSMPERFELEYIGEDGQAHRPAMLHRVIYGSMERFIGILLEHTNGALPVWLSPVQVKVVSITDRTTDLAEEITKKLRDAGLRVESDIRQNTVQYKVRDAELMKIPYILVIGDKEADMGTIAVRKRGEKQVEFGVHLDRFIERIHEEIKHKK